VLAAIAAKGVKELTYHREYAAGWAVRLGDGTDLSHDRMGAAMTAVWPLVGELFHPHEVELRLAAAGVAVDPSTLRPEFDAVVAEVGRVATLPQPAGESAAGRGRDGEHGVELVTILAEMQGLARETPGGVW